MRAIVTGAASGIGWAVCEKIARDCHAGGEVASIVAADVNAARLQDLFEHLTLLYDARVATSVNDVSEVDVPARLVGRAEQAFGGLDAVFSNAGRSMKSSLLEAELSDWEALFSLNVTTPFLLAQAAAPLLKISTGCIVMTTSICGSHPSAFGAYSITKAAAIMLMRQLSVELGPFGIRVNCVSPSMVDTAATASAYSNPELRQRRSQSVPLRRIAKPEEIAEAMAFLASPAASYVSGIDMQIDGAFGNMLMFLNQNADDWK